MLNLFNPKQTSRVGIITYIESTTFSKKEVEVNKVFWRNSYEPSTGEILAYLKDNGYTHVLGNTISFVYFINLKN